MPKSHTSNSTTTSRRSLFAAAPVAALALSGTPAIPPVPPHPDAAILALGERLRANRAEYDSRTLPFMDGTPEPPENAARVSVLVLRGHRMVEELADMVATTQDGLRVKAAVVLDYFAFNADGSPSWMNHDELMGWSLARDLVAAGAA